MKGPTYSISSYRYCSAPNTACVYASATATYSCEPCGGPGQRCCGINSSGPGTDTSGTCNTSLRCVYTGGVLSYTCAP